MQQSRITPYTEAIMPVLATQHTQRTVNLAAGKKLKT